MTLERFKTTPQGITPDSNGELVFLDDVKALLPSPDREAVIRRAVSLLLQMACYGVTPIDDYGRDTTEKRAAIDTARALFTEMFPGESFDFWDKFINLSENIHG